jgi:hypothetical protein
LVAVTAQAPLLASSEILLATSAVGRFLLRTGPTRRGSEGMGDPFAVKGDLGGTILELLQERPEWRHLAGLARPGKTKTLRKPRRIGRGEQFCTDAVGQLADLEQRLALHRRYCP